MHSWPKAGTVMYSGAAPPRTACTLAWPVLTPKFVTQTVVPPHPHVGMRPESPWLKSMNEVVLAAAIEVWLGAGLALAGPTPVRTVPAASAAVPAANDRRRVRVVRD